MAKTTSIAVVSIPAFSHQLSIVEFCKRLIQLNLNFHITCIIPSIGSPSSASKSIFQSLPSTNTHSIFIPINNIPLGINSAVQLQLAISRSMPSIRQFLVSLNSNSRLVALIADYSANEALEFSKELNMASYIYFPLAAMVLSMCLYSKELDESISCEFKVLSEPVRIPGCNPIRGEDLPNTLQDRKSEIYKQFLQRSKRLHLADGILVNSFLEMEPEVIRALQEDEFGNGKPLVYPIGPNVQSGQNLNGSSSECLRWLDDQKPKSVLYVNFGSGGTLSQEQLNELAFGLELSGQKFLWVLRAPNRTASANCFSDNSSKNPLQFLPLGFLERTKEQDLVIPLWAPQIDILAHNATGGFLSHCGWFSILESFAKGFPLIAWPLFAEQRMNAVLLADDLKVALRPEVNCNGIVQKEAIAFVIKSLMEADEDRGIRKRMKKLQDAAVDELKEDGSSTRILERLVLTWNNFGDGRNGTF